ncbi:MAG: EthD domain-containing protein [Actinomycetes bacterium]
MFKVIAFVKRSPEIGVEEFHERWRCRHADLIRASPAAASTLLRYEQSHRSLRDYDHEDCIYDGAAVQWYRDWDSFIAMVSDAEYQATVGVDERELFDQEAMLVVFTEVEDVIVPRPADLAPPYTRLVCAVRRKPGMDLDEFHTYWLAQHGPLNRDDADIRAFFLAYEQNHRLRSDYDRPGCDIDGVTIQTFESASRFFEMALDPIYEARIHPDELKFLARDNLIWMLTDAEDVILDRT